MTCAIETRNLTKNYGGNRGIRNVNLVVEEGDIFGYLGPNGAGKSTSIRCLLGMIHPTSGEAYVLGKQVGREQTEILKCTGYMPSEAFFYPSMSVDEVIRYAAKVRGLDCSGEANRLCDRLEVDRKKKIGQLSLGNRKKVGIVCALQHKPDLIIMDEPTSGLDPLMQEAFFALLMERNREGATCFLSSHVLQEVKRYCRNAGIIRDGELIKVESVENLTKTSLRRVKVAVPEALQGRLLERLAGVEGMSEMTRRGVEISFSCRGQMKRLLEALDGLEIEDLLIAEPSLEEVFLHFYD